MSQLCDAYDLEISTRCDTMHQSSNCFDNLFIIYLFLKRNSILNVIMLEHFTFLAACSVTSS